MTIPPKPDRWHFEIATPVLWGIEVDAPANPDDGPVVVIEKGVEIALGAERSLARLAGADVSWPVIVADAVELARTVWPEPPYRSDDGRVWGLAVRIAHAVLDDIADGVMRGRLGDARQVLTQPAGCILAVHPSEWVNLNAVQDATPIEILRWIIDNTQHAQVRDAALSQFIANGGGSDS